jgi:hypothetical protein
MSLKLNELQKVVKNVVKKEKNIDILRSEIVRTLGPTILVSRGLERMAESANERLDILEAMDRPFEKIRPALLLKFVDSDSPEVRKLVARLIPESFLKVFMKDSDAGVRAATARRLSSQFVSEMVRRFPYDDTLRDIAKNKRLLEAGVPDPEIDDEEFDMYGMEPIGEFFGYEYPDLSDAWYDTMALKILNMYGRNIEEQWEEATVHRYVDSVASMGVDVDRQKLLDAVNDLLEKRADAVLEENSLSSFAKKLRLEDTTAMPVISESVDPAKQMITAGYTTSEYIKNFENLFLVRHATVVNPAYKTLREGNERVTHPISARIPGSSFRNVDERALDTYVNAWNTRESILNKPHYRLQWSPDPENISMVNFYLELK